jgi:hypothetical protein
MPKRWRKRVRVLLRKDAVAREVEEELLFHLELETEKNLRAGMSPEEARRQARLAFGGVERVRAEVHDARWIGWAGGMALDFKLGLRMLVKHGALTLVGGLGMAVAVAIAAGLFTFMTEFYYSHPPLQEGERIVSVENRNLLDSEDWRASLFDYHTWRESLTSVRELAAFRRPSRNVQLSGGLFARVPVAEMTASGFRLARVPPLLGRPLLDADEVQGAPPVVVVGHEEWHRDFAADPAAIGKEVRIDGIVHTIVGVMPALRANGSQLQSTLRQLGGGTEMRMGSTWTVLIVAQVAVAVLPVVLGLAADTIWRPLPTPSFPAAEILTFRLDRDQDAFFPLRPKLEASFANQQAELMRRVEAEPGVSGVTYALNLPISGERLKVETD